MPIIEDCGEPKNDSIDTDDLTVFKVLLSNKKLNTLSRKQKKKFIEDHPLDSFDDLTFKYWYNDLKGNNPLFYIIITYPFVRLIAWQFKYAVTKFRNEHSEFLI